MGPIISNVEGIEAVNEYAVRFKLKMTAVSMPSEVARLFVLPQAAYEKMGKDAFFANRSAPGRTSSEQDQGRDVDRRSERGLLPGAPKIKTLIFKRVPDASTRVAEVLAGTSDIIIAISPTSWRGSRPAATPT